MKSPVGPGAVAAMLTWNSNSCPSCGAEVFSVEIEQVRVVSVVPDVVSYALCENCQAMLDSGDEASFGWVVRDAENAITAAIAEMDEEAMLKAQAIPQPSPTLH